MNLIIWWGDHPAIVIATETLAAVGLIVLAWSLAVIAKESDEAYEALQYPRPDLSRRPSNISIIRRPFDWADLPEYADGL